MTFSHNNKLSGSRTVRPLVETLEDRVVMNSAFGFHNWNFTPDITESQGVVHVEGSIYNDSVSVQYDGNDVVVSVTANGFTQTETFANAIKVTFDGNQGNDTFINNTYLRSNVDGGAGDDFIQGGANNDTIYGGTGHDILNGKGGSDRLYGESGFDWIVGSDGNDYIDGGNDRDFLYGNKGNDTLLGGSGDDDLDGHVGDDYLDGEDGHDYILGHSGDDTMLGGKGHDYLSGYFGNDYIRGGDGNDTLHGSWGHDSLLGDADNDEIYGSYGNDLLDGGDGDDYVNGGAHADLVFGGDGIDTVRGGSGDDLVSGGRVDFDPNGPSSMGDQSDFNYDYVFGDSGSDYIVKSDKIMFNWWLDSAMDLNENDTLVPYGWFPLGVYINFAQYGHLYTGSIH